MSGIELSFEEWETFKESSIGRIIIKQLHDVRMSLCESMGAGACVGKSAEETAINYAVNAGQIQGIDWVLAPTIMEKNDEA